MNGEFGLEASMRLCSMARCSSRSAIDIVRPTVDIYL